MGALWEARCFGSSTASTKGSPVGGGVEVPCAGASAPLLKRTCVRRVVTGMARRPAFVERMADGEPERMMKELCL